MQSRSRFAIVGGGVAGLSCAIALEQLGIDFQLFEQSKQLKGIGAGFGLAANAMQALSLLGLKQQVEKIGYYMDSYAILDDKGKTLVSPNTASLSKKYQQQNFSIHRADLHLFLLSKVREQKITLAKKAKSFERFGEKVVVTFQDSSMHECDFLIIADGIRSALREQIIPSATPRYAGYCCWRATIDNSAIKLERGSETWGKRGRFGMTPLVNNRIYWYACVNSKQNSAQYKSFKVKDLQEHFASYHPLVKEILSRTKDEDLLWNDITDIRPLSHFAYANILLIGDAAHATTPNMGQGACQAIEDVAVLKDELSSQSEVIEAFRNFEKRRLSRTKYITRTSAMIGKIAQWENPTSIAVRNAIMKILPASLSQKPLEKLFSHDFMTINKSRK